MAISTDEASLWLPRRKNKPCASLLRRRCWCSAHAATCAVHALPPLLRGTAVGTQPFAQFSGSGARRILRSLLSRIGVESASLFGTHDIRRSRPATARAAWRAHPFARPARSRGHADDIDRAGAPTAVTKERGGWASNAYLAYIDRVRVESERVAAARNAASDSSDSSDNSSDS